MSKLYFSKYSGAGNHFILLDGRKGLPFSLYQKTIQTLCQNGDGVGADGMIIAEVSKNADAKIRIFNADGSEASMCGNGLRCFILYLRELGVQKTHYLIESNVSMHRCFYKNAKVTTEISAPSQWRLNLELGSEYPLAHHVNTGVPHTVMFHDALEPLNVNALGHTICFHPHFAPQGTNVNFVKRLKGNALELRTYERGVGEETLACGTGATASALLAAKLFSFSSPITLKTRSNQILQLSFKQVGPTFSDLFLTGPAKKTFEGSLWLNDL